ncbi:hypothetical protein L873DRAFT_1811977, partial [Choiromyces venosus 120613-1]
MSTQTQIVKLQGFKRVPLVLALFPKNLVISPFHPPEIKKERQLSYKYHTQSSTIQNGNSKPERIDVFRVNLTSKAQRADYRSNQLFCPKLCAFDAGGNLANERTLEKRRGVKRSEEGGASQEGWERIGS